jgi:uncharacterized protein (TIGR01777 family)
MSAERAPTLKRVAITGASGFLGVSLTEYLRRGGYEVLRIGRGGSADILWDPAARVIAPQALDGVDAVVHLAGEPIAQRWTAHVRRALKESRVRGTELIAEACARATPRPAALLSGSAIGIYGDRGDDVLDESSQTGGDHLAEVGRAWEGATKAASDAGVRVVHARTGIVLHPRGGALAKMLLPFQLGVGGRLGSGKQWMSWIARTDWLAAVHFLLRTASVRGPVNLTAPEPATNGTFTSTLGRVLGRPSIAPVPGFVLRALYGEMADAALLSGQRVLPRALEHAGFAFAFPTLTGALRHELDRP